MTVLPRIALPLLAGAAISVLAACTQAEGPAGSDAGLVEDLAALETMNGEEDHLHDDDDADALLQDGDVAGAAAAPVEPASHTDDDHAHDDHTHDDHGHDDHAHDDHAHDDHDHDHDHDHAGGTPHVHGIADLALVLEGEELTGELITPLANFGLSESEGIITAEVTESLPRLVLLTGGNCTAGTPEAEIDRSGGHTDAKIQFSWTCTNPSEVMFASFAGFAAYPGFETVNTVFIADGAQKSTALTANAPQMSLR